jgi:hypothetical protein
LAALAASAAAAPNGALGSAQAIRRRRKLATIQKSVDESPYQAAAIATAAAAAASLRARGPPITDPAMAAIADALWAGLDSSAGSVDSAMGLLDQRGGASVGVGAAALGLGAQPLGVAGALLALAATSTAAPINAAVAPPGSPPFAERAVTPPTAPLPWPPQLAESSEFAASRDAALSVPSGASSVPSGAFGATAVSPAFHEAANFPLEKEPLDFHVLEAQAIR